MEKITQDHPTATKLPTGARGWLIALAIFAAMAIVAWMIWGDGPHAYLIAWDYAKNIWIGPVNPVTAPIL
jgi:hypothetical protein